MERDGVDGIVDAPEREIGTVPVRFDPADAQILAAFADGVLTPLAAHELNRWATHIALTPGFHVFNLVAPGTIEETLLDVLDAKINMFELVIGEVDMILGHLATDQDFEEIVTDLGLGAADYETFRLGTRALGDRMLQKSAYLEIKALDDRIFGDALGPGASR